MPVATSEEKKLEWKTRVENQRQSGLSIEKWCLQNQVSPHVFHYWKDKLFPKQLQKSNFAEMPMQRSTAISLQVSGLHVRIGSDCPLQLRKDLFALFERL